MAGGFLATDRARSIMALQGIRMHVVQKSICLKTLLEEMSLIAILRGIPPGDAVSVTAELYRAGLRIVEVPLNSPDPFASIRTIADAFGRKMLVGAGTVLVPGEVARVAESGGQFIVSPNFNPEVVTAAKAQEMICIPGVQTPSEAFAALRCGADAIKIFPAEACPPPVIKALRAVLPADTIIIPVGGINEANMASYWAAGVNGFGIGSNLYQPGKSLQEIGNTSQRYASVIWQLKKV
jgi:2-dehydro-3-deoxyphosphogalactonate aldolase